MAGIAGGHFVIADQVHIAKKLPLALFPAHLRGHDGYC
jgi:hypothetical protein